MTVLHSVLHEDVSKSAFQALGAVPRDPVLCGKAIRLFKADPLDLVTEAVGIRSRHVNGVRAPLFIDTDGECRSEVFAEIEHRAPHSRFFSEVL